MSTGVPSVDEQHRQLVGVLGRVLEAMERGRSRAEVGTVLDELDRYTAVAFSLGRAWPAPSRHASR